MATTIEDVLFEEQAAKEAEFYEGIQQVAIRAKCTISRQAPPADLIVVSPKGARLAVEMKLSPLTHGEIAREKRHILASRLNITRIVYVAIELDRRQKKIAAAHGIDAVSPKLFPSWLKKWIEEVDRPARAIRPKRTVASSTRTNLTEVIVLAAAIAEQLEAQIRALKQQRPNDPDAQAKHRADLASFEALYGQVLDLQKAISNLRGSRSKVADEQVTSAAMSFKKGFAQWWTQRYVAAVDQAYTVGIALTTTGLLSLMGVDQKYAVAMAGAIVVGRAVKDRASRGARRKVSMTAQAVAD